MDISALPAVPGARKRRKRVGRGIGSGHGKTATRGTKGQRARTGSRKRPGFEGGQTPLIRRLPKRGFKRKETGRAPKPEIVNVGELDRLPEGRKLTPEVLAELGVIRYGTRRVKLLGNGNLTKAVSIAAHQASRSAQEKISQAGGTIEILGGKIAQPSAKRVAAPGSEPSGGKAGSRPAA